MPKIWLLSHPVSADDKAKAKSMGLRIVDSRFSSSYSDDEIYKPKKKKSKIKLSKD